MPPELPPELTCRAGAYLGVVIGRFRSKPDDMLDCFASVQSLVPNGRLLTFKPGWGCYLVQQGTEDFDDKQVLSSACEFYPLHFVPEVTMGRDFAACHFGGRACAAADKAGLPQPSFGRACCVRPGFRECAEGAHSWLAKCSASQGRLQPSLDSYEVLRAQSVLSCLVQQLRFAAVIELFTGRGTFLNSFAHVASQARVFSIDEDPAMIEGVQARLGGTVVDVSYGRGPMLRLPGDRFRPARRVISRLENGLYFFPTRALPEPNATNRSHGTDHFLEEPESLLHAICASLPAGAATLVLLDAAEPLAREWSILFEECADIVAVVLFNVNHPNKGGYVREHLLSTSNNWAEILRWQEVVLNECGAYVSALDRQFLMRRQASVLLHRKMC